MKSICIDRLAITLTGIDEVIARQAFRLLGSAIGQKVAASAAEEQVMTHNPTAQELADHIADQVATTVRGRLAQQTEER
jgi:hypothetical protein